jgi:hypothetical protein
MGSADSLRGTKSGRVSLRRTSIETRLQLGIQLVSEMTVARRRPEYSAARWSQTKEKLPPAGTKSFRIRLSKRIFSGLARDESAFSHSNLHRI